MLLCFAQKQIRNLSFIVRKPLTATGFQSNFFAGLSMYKSIVADRGSLDCEKNPAIEITRDSKSILFFSEKNFHPRQKSGRVFSAVKKLIRQGLFATLAFTAMAQFASASENIAANKPVFASSQEAAAHAPGYAVDGNSKSRWSSAFSDNQWIAIDLGENHYISGVKLHWQNSYGSEYLIQTSQDGENWNTVFSQNNGAGGVEEVTLNNEGRYVRMYGLKRFTRYGFSLFEFEVYGYQPQPAVNLAANATVTTSSNENTSLDGKFAVDGNSKSRWSSGFTDNQWIALDLGGNHHISKVKLNWQNSYGSEYLIQTSHDGENWTTVFNQSNGTGGIEEVTVSSEGRYVRMYGLKRSTRYGFSLFEFEVYGHQAQPAINRAANVPVMTSSNENASLDGKFAVDENSKSRWSSGFADNQWIVLDLGEAQRINQVKLHWQNSYAKEYRIQFSLDGEQWHDAYHNAEGDGGVDEINLHSGGRYLRILCLTRVSRYGFSLFEIEAIGYPINSAILQQEYAAAEQGNQAPAPNQPSDPEVDSPVEYLLSYDAFEDRIELSWSVENLPADATFFQLLRNGEVIDTLYDVAAGFTDHHVEADKFYQYQLAACSAANDCRLIDQPLSAGINSSEQLTLSWILPSARENGEFMNADEIGGYEVRFLELDGKVARSLTVNDATQTRLNIGQNSGAYLYEIAIFDKNGLYSLFVPIEPLTAAR